MREYNIAATFINRSSQYHGNPYVTIKLIVSYIQNLLNMMANIYYAKL